MEKAGKESERGEVWEEESREEMMTFTLSMTILYPEYLLAFLLVDSKDGGRMEASCEPVELLDSRERIR